MSAEEDLKSTSDLQDLLCDLLLEDRELLRRRFGLSGAQQNTIEELAAQNGLSTAQMKKKITAVLLSLVGR